MIVCDVSRLEDEDLGTVDALARLQLLARRHGLSLVLVHPSPALVELLTWAGLADACGLVDGAGSGVQAGRQPEQREQAGGVEEEGDAADALA